MLNKVVYNYSAKRGIVIACRPSVCPSVWLWRWWIIQDHI